MVVSASAYLWEKGATLLRPLFLLGRLIPQVSLSGLQFSCLPHARRASSGFFRIAEFDGD